MKGLITTVFLMFAFFCDGQIVSMSKTINGKKYVVNQNSVVQDSTGALISFDKWFPLIGIYDLVPLPVGTDSVQKFILKPYPPEVAAKMKEERERRIAARNQSPLTVGKPLTDFDIKDITGKRWKLDDLKGKLIFINYWFVNCKPCVEEIPLLMNLKREFSGSDIVFLAISPIDDKDILKQASDKLEFYYHQFSKEEAGKITESASVSAYPTYLLIDKKGVIRYTSTGLSSETVNTLRIEMDKLLKTD
jgi:peroxiredoxin